MTAFCDISTTAFAVWSDLLLAIYCFSRSSCIMVFVG